MSGTLTLDPTLQEILKTIYPARSSQDLITLGWIKQGSRQGNKAQLVLEIPKALATQAADLEKQIQETLLSQLSGLEQVQVILSAHQPRPATTKPQPKMPQAIPGITHIIAIASGKGGVGKSTTAFHLTLALSRLSLKVGLLDLDIYGPSLPHLLKRWDQPISDDGKTMEPLEQGGIKWMSMGWIMPKDKAAIWRGPMVHSAVQQLLHQVNWGTLDILILDLPPGTGDVPLSLAQSAPLTGAVLVTTPPEIALLDVRRSMEMFKKLRIPLLGLVENMAGFTCPSCHTTTPVFSQRGGETEAQKQDIPFLGSIPLSPEIGQSQGEEAFTNLPSLHPYDDLATRLLQQLKT